MKSRIKSVIFSGFILEHELTTTFQPMHGPSGKGVVEQRDEVLANNTLSRSPSIIITGFTPMASATSVLPRSGTNVPVAIILGNVITPSHSSAVAKGSD